MGKIVVRTTDELRNLGLWDCTKRSVPARKRVDTLCVLCKEIRGNAVFGNLMTRLRKFGAGWHCPECQIQVMANKARERLAIYNSWQGKKHSEVTKAKIKATRSEASAKANLTRKSMEEPERKRLADWMKSQEFRDKATKTLIEKYNVSNARLIPNTLQKARATLMVKYGVDSYSKTDEFKATMRGLNHHKRRSPEFIRLSTGEIVVDLARAYEKNPSNAIRELRRYGENAFWEYLKSKRKVSSLEILGEELFGLPHHNKELEWFKYRPDFVTENAYINLDGLWDHSEGRRINPTYHFEMREKYEEYGLRILQFRDDEVVYKSDIVKSIVDGTNGRHIKISARKCKIRSLTNTESRYFFEKTHLMGSYGAAKGYGLFYDSRLVCAISIRKQGVGIEIARFSSDLNTRVVGGFTKLLSHVIKEYKPEVIVSFCDLRYGTGKVYESAGFKRASVSLGWKWTDFDKTYHRLSCRANMDARRLSEAEHAKELRLYRIYDAGQAKYIKYFGKDPKT